MSYTNNEEFKNFLHANLKYNGELSFWYNKHIVEVNVQDGEWIRHFTIRYLDSEIMCHTLWKNDKSILFYSKSEMVDTIMEMLKLVVDEKRTCAQMVQRVKATA